MHKEQRRLLMLSSLGGVLEFYDFIIFALFAGYIARAFFPVANHLAGLMITFATFAVGYLVRPLGGIVFGHFGDRIGRKATFTCTILLMAIATMGMGLVPEYASIGIAAPVLIILLRVIQGLSIGGEIPGAITYVSESFSKNKGLACGVVFSALIAGIVLGSIVHAVFVTLIAEPQMQAYGWRIPFILGGIFGLASYCLRRELQESPVFFAIGHAVEKFPVLVVFKREWRALIVGSFLAGFCAVIINVLFLFLPAYFTEVLRLPANSHVWERTLTIAAGAALTGFFGYMTDRIGARRLAIALAILTAITAYPVFAIYVYYPQYYWFSLAITAVLIGFSAGTIPSMFSELFPAAIRYSGIAVSYNLGFALFGGLTPLISLSLIYYTDILTMPALYLFLAAIATLSVLLWGCISISTIKRSGCEEGISCR